MAGVSSGSFETTKYGNVRSIKFEWNLVEQSIAGNYSLIHYVLTGAGSDNGKWYYTKNGYLYIDGLKVYDQGDSKVRLGYGTILKEDTIKIFHNADGSKSFSASGAATIYDYSNFQNGTGSWQLPNIARVSKFTLSANEVNLGDTVNINISSESNDFIHKIYYSINNANEICLANNVKDSYSWIIPKNYANKVTDYDSFNIKFRVVTVANNTDIGSNEINLKVNIPNTEEFKPTISNVTLNDAVNDISIYGKYIKGVSKIKGMVSAGGAYGSTISSYHITVNNETFTNKEFITSILSSNQQELVVIVTDSRGRSNSYTKTLDIFDYDVPVITNFNIDRDETSKEVINVDFNSTIYSIDNHNTGQFSIMYKKMTDNNYLEYKIDDDALTLETTDLYKKYSGTISIDGIDTNSTYNLYLSVSDKFSSINSLNNDIKTDFRLLNISSDKKYFAIGKKIEKPGYLEIAMKLAYYEEMLRIKNDYVGDVLSCSGIDNGELKYNNENNTIEIKINGETYCISLTKKG